MEQTGRRRRGRPLVAVVGLQVCEGGQRAPIAAAITATRRSSCRTDEAARDPPCGGNVGSCPEQRSWRSVLDASRVRRVSRAGGGRGHRALRAVHLDVPGHGRAVPRRDQRRKHHPSATPIHVTSQLTWCRRLPRWPCSAAGIDGAAATHERRGGSAPRPGNVRDQPGHARGAQRIQ
ncbi:hypothetical protein OPV22_020684 [Ensete ventricosum]|uniref:Uncharacterized protein n=1 Tax=Ensete ventricosum TaxID=4639 RepID=A0AAV8QLX2_ENSVE|nr:hypothetical protein OPV22_020684 [Ensete ventricosum]